MGRQWPSSEHLYQAMKTTDDNIRLKLFLECSTPREAKAFGRKIKLRPEWEEIKLDIMLNIVRMKFFQNISIALDLIGTKDRYLIEGNYWGDTFWGVCNGVGKNHLGLTLMRVREEITQMGI